ncbi:MAG: YbfB/YjiJ family MFS transporter [Rhodobiaceae bacterium]|nr:YbfB/YjiJ family MFS transporter [Rhodobiaceae bacterium]
MRQGPQSPFLLAFGGLIALAAAMGIGRFVYTPILPDMIAGGVLGGASAGFVAAANFLGYLAGALIAASPLLSGRRTGWITAGLLTSAVTTAAMALFETEAAFALLRFIGGFASAIVLVFATSVVLDGLAVAGRGGLSAVHFAGVGTGIALSALLVHAFKGADLWPQQWIVSGVVTLVAAVGVMAMVREAGPAGARSGFAAGSLRFDTRLSGLLVAYGLFGFGYVITATFIVAIVRAAPDLARYETGIWLMVGLAAAPSVWLWSKLSGAAGILGAFAIACLVEAAGVIASVASSHAAGIFFAAACLGGTFMGLTALGLVAARTLPVSGGGARDARRVVALMTAAFGTGQVLGPTLAGAMFDHTGNYVAASVAAAAALILAAAITIWILTDLRKAAATVSV